MTAFKELLDEYKSLPKPIFYIFISRIVNALGAFVGPLLTLLLSDKLGMNTSEVGTYIMIQGILFLPASSLGGYLADHFQRKRTVVILTILQALSFLACAFFEPSILTAYLIMLGSFFSLTAQPASSAIAADLTVKENRQAAFSLIYLGINIGFSIGPLIAGLLYYRFLPLIFLGDALTTLIAIFIFYKHIPESKPTYDIEKEQSLDDDERAEKGSVFSALLKRPSIIAFGLISTLLSFEFAQVHFSLPLYIKDLYGIELGSRLFGILMSINGLVVILGTIFIVGHTKKLKPSLNVSFAALFCAFGLGLLYFNHSRIALIISTILWTIGEILNATNVGVYIANHAPKSHRARFNSLYGIISGAGYALSPKFMGIYFTHSPIKNVWIMTFFVGILCSLLMLIMYAFESKKDKRKLSL